MSHQNAQVLNKAHKAGRTIFDSLQGMAETTISIWRQIGDVQRKSFSDAVEASQAQFQLVAKLNAPYEFANAEADLIKKYGQRHADRIREIVEFVTQAWQEYGNRFEVLQSGTGDM